MIEVVPSSRRHGARLRLRPPGLTAGSSGAVRGAGRDDVAGGQCGWLAGNVFAPAFALLHSAIVAARCAGCGAAANAAKCIASVRTRWRSAHRAVRARCSGRIPTGCGCASRRRRKDLAGFQWQAGRGGQLPGPAERRELAGSCRIYWRPRRPRPMTHKGLGNDASEWFLQAGHAVVARPAHCCWRRRWPGRSRPTRKPLAAQHGHAGVTATSQHAYDAHMIVLWICVVIGIIVFGAMAYAMFKFRKSKGAVADAVQPQHQARDHLDRGADR